MRTNNVERVIAQSNTYITNINRLLKGIKLYTSADFIHTNSKGIIVTINKIVTLSDLKVVEKYMKKLNNVDISNVMSFRLPQSKLFLKVLGIPYLIENTNFLIIFPLLLKLLKE